MQIKQKKKFLANFVNLFSSHQQRDFVWWSIQYFICRKKRLLCMSLLLNSSVSPCCQSWQARCQVDVLFGADGSFKSRAWPLCYSHRGGTWHNIVFSRRTTSRNPAGLRAARTFEGGVGMCSISWKYAELILP